MSSKHQGAWDGRFYVSSSYVELKLRLQTLKFRVFRPVSHTDSSIFPLSGNSVSFSTLVQNWIFCYLPSPQCIAMTFVCPPSHSTLRKTKIIENEHVNGFSMKFPLPVVYPVFSDSLINEGFGNTIKKAVCGDLRFWYSTCYCWMFWALWHWKGQILNLII